MTSAVEIYGAAADAVEEVVRDRRTAERAAEAALDAAASFCPTLPCLAALRREKALAARNARIADLRESGVSRADLATRFGLSARQIQRICYSRRQGANSGRCGN